MLKSVLDLSRGKVPILQRWNKRKSHTWTRNYVEFIMIRSSLKDNHWWRGGGGGVVISRQHGVGGEECHVWFDLTYLIWGVGGDRVSRITSDGLAPKHWPQVMSSNVSWHQTCLQSITCKYCDIDWCHRHVSTCLKFARQSGSSSGSRDALPFSQDRCRDDVIQWCIWEKVSAVPRVQLFLLKCLQQCRAESAVHSSQCRGIFIKYWYSAVWLILTQWNLSNTLPTFNAKYLQRSFVKKFKDEWRKYIKETP